MKKKIDIETACLELFCAGASIDLISQGLGLTYRQTEDYIRERLKYLHSEKP